MNILFIGDIVGQPGRRAVKHFLPRLRREYEVDLVVANAENAAHGRGLTPKLVDELLNLGIDVLTSGNHIWDQKEIIPIMDSDLPLLRPINYPEGVPGRGYLVHEGVLVVNLMGRTFMYNIDCPFRAMDRLLATMPDVPPVVLVDFHADATSEKVAMGWYLDGRVSAVVGTHSHVPTADPWVLPGGTAYVSDLGMTGPKHSVIGVKTEAVIERFLTQMPNKFEVAEGPAVMGCVVVEVDSTTGRAQGIRRTDREEKE